jgi:hypothetical protein
MVMDTFYQQKEQQYTTQHYNELEPKRIKHFTIYTTARATKTQTNYIIVLLLSLLLLSSSSSSNRS